jgi:hypothetical protein
VTDTALEATPAQTNALSEGLRQGRMPLPCVVVIFGATGDLTKRKLVPGLYALAADGLVPPGFSIVGAGRTEQSTDEFRNAMRDAVAKYGRVPLRDDVWNVFADGLRYCSYDLDQEGGLDALHDTLAELDRERGTGGNRIFYFSIPPSGFAPLAERLGAEGLSHSDNGFRRMVVEKPFGRDLASARDLNRQLHVAFGSSSASTTTSARRRCRTSSSSASPTESSSRSGIASTSTTCRSPSPRTSGWRGAASTTRSPARCATSSRTTSCN